MSLDSDSHNKEWGVELSDIFRLTVTSPYSRTLTKFYKNSKSVYSYRGYIFYHLCLITIQPWEENYEENYEGTYEDNCL